MADEINEGAHNEGSVNDEAEASGARHAYAASAASNDDKAAASAVEAGSYNEGSNGDEAAASAARRAYAASFAADDNKAAASAARRARAGIVARCTAEADEINEGAHNEGSVDDKAEGSTARRAYAASAASNDDKAAASAVEAGAYDEGSDGDEAAASAARRTYAASVAADDDQAAASTARRARTAIAALRTAEANEIDNGAHNEGSLDNEAKARVRSTRRLQRRRGIGLRRKARARGHSDPTHGGGRRYQQRGLQRGL